MPASILIKIGKNAPKKVRNTIVNSDEGQNNIDIGSQASGGIGLIISNTGKENSFNFRDIPIGTPIAIANTTAIANPKKTRLALFDQLSK
jgi:hypothetical protein